MLRKTTSTRLTPQQELLSLTLVIATLLGVYIRLANVLPAPFPINDGGLFYNMTRDLQANGYALPAFTTYNHAEIPFAYPPLAFFLAGLLADIFKWDLLDLFRLLPALLSLATIPGVYWLAKDVLKSDLQAALAALVYALTPGAFSWLIMGGGLTRGLGLAFSLLTLHQAYQLYQTQKWRHVFATALFAAGTVLSHPEMAVHTVAGALALFLFWGRNKKSLGLSVLTAGLTLLLTAPWWLTLLLRHGFGPVLAAGGTSWHSLEALPTLLLFNFADEPALTLTGCLALLGLIVSLGQKNYFLVTWLGLIYLSEPRSAALYLMPLWAMLAALALEQVIFPGLRSRVGTRSMAAPQPGTEVGSVAGAQPSAKSHPTASIPMLESGAAKLAFGVLIIYLLLGAYTVTWNERRDFTMRASDMAAMQWVRENTAADSRFALITGEGPMQDTLSEWFPALTERTSVATVQGYEWKPGGALFKKMNEYGVLQTCLYQGKTCLPDWAQATGQAFDYVILRQKNTDNGLPDHTPLAVSLEQFTQLKKVFQTGGITIYEFQKP